MADERDGEEQKHTRRPRPWEGLTAEVRSGGEERRGGEGEKE